MLPLTPLPLSDAWTSLQLEPGQWEHYELQLPPIKSSPANLELLVSLERTAGEEGPGGDPLLFLKPFDAPGRSEPTVDAASADLAAYADLRSFLLQQPRHFLLRRLRGAPSGVSTRFYVSVYNNQHSRLQQPANVSPGGGGRVRTSCVAFLSRSREAKRASKGTRLWDAPACSSERRGTARPTRPAGTYCSPACGLPPTSPVLCSCDCGCSFGIWRSARWSAR